MRIAIEFENIDEAYPVLKFAFDNRNLAPPIGVPASEAETLAGTSTTAPVTPAAPARKRRTKAEIAADEAVAAAAAAATQVQTSEFDDAPEPVDEFDAPPAAVKVTKDDVRAALVGYQERLGAKNKDVEAVRTVVLGLLKKVGGADKLGALTEDKFQAVIDAANAAK